MTIAASAATFGTADSTSGTTAVVTKTFTAGSTAELFIMCGSGATITTPASTPSETWVLVKALNDPVTDAMRSEVWKADNVTGGSTTITETFSGSVINRLIAVKEISGTTGYDSAAAANNGQDQNAPGTGTDAVTSNATPSLTSQPALFSGWVTDKAFNRAAPVAGTGYTDDGVGGSGLSGLNTVRSESKRVTATTGQAATFTESADSRYFVFVAGYLEPLAPAITAQPTNQTAFEGNTATFNITATTSGGVLHYQWKFNGSNVGTDTNSYARSNCVFADNGGIVTCVVTDDNGSTTSSNAYLTVLIDAKIFLIKG